MKDLRNVPHLPDKDLNFLKALSFFFCHRIDCEIVDKNAKKTNETTRINIKGFATFNQHRLLDLHKVFMWKHQRNNNLNIKNIPSFITHYPRLSSRLSRTHFLIKTTYTLFSRRLSAYFYHFHTSSAFINLAIFSDSCPTRKMHSSRLLPASISPLHVSFVH